MKDFMSYDKIRKPWLLFFTYNLGCALLLIPDVEAYLEWGVLSDHFRYFFYFLSAAIVFAIYYVGYRCCYRRPETRLLPFILITIIPTIAHTPYTQWRSLLGFSLIWALLNVSLWQANYRQSKGLA